MIPILLLILVCCVGVLGVVAMGLGLWQEYQRGRRDRVRYAARRNAERVARESARVALKPTPTRTPAVAARPRVNDLTGVIATLEESVRFQTVPAHDVAVSAPRRAAKGSVAPPFPARAAVMPVPAPAMRMPAPPPPARMPMATPVAVTASAPVRPQAPPPARVQMAAPVQPPVRPQMYPVVPQVAKPPPIPGGRRLPPPIPPARRR